MKKSRSQLKQILLLFISSLTKLKLNKKRESSYCKDTIKYLNKTGLKLSRVILDH